ncbi:hypothetical protein IJI02_01205 [Candidatus Saccharibacteria bacterium]|nr:hypothetical protein [Candidatus Saccharibacteria bacterium]
MKKLLLLLATFVVVVLGVEAVYHWDYLATGRILPPQITLENCEEIKTEVWKYDWDRELALAVAKAESKCDTQAKGDTDLVFMENGREYGYSVGAFQIRILPGREKCDTYDVEKNVKCAYDLYFDAGKNFNDWSMYLNGSYKNYMWHTIF